MKCRKTTLLPVYFALGSVSKAYKVTPAYLVNCNIHKSLEKLS